MGGYPLLTVKFDLKVAERKKLSELATFIAVNVANLNFLAAPSGF